MLSAEVVIRSATDDDLVAILDIYNEAILNTTSVYSEVPHTLEMRRTWFNDKLRDGFPVLVAQHNGQVIGFGAYGHFRNWPCYRFTVEHSVYVHTTFRGQGLGKTFLQHLINMARQANIHAMIAGIDSANHASYNLHRSFGFQEVAHFKQVGFKFGKWLDLKFLELILE